MSGAGNGLKFTTQKRKQTYPHLRVHRSRPRSHIHECEYESECTSPRKHEIQGI